MPVAKKINIVYQSTASNKRLPPGFLVRKIFTMSSPHLNSDVLREIFGHLSQEELKLCAFVNRQWCRNAIPLIWYQPFDRSLPKKSIGTLGTMLSLIDDTRRKALIKLG